MEGLRKKITVSRGAAELFRLINVFDFSLKEGYTIVKPLTNSAHLKSQRRNIDNTKTCRFVDDDSFGVKNEEYLTARGPRNMITNLMGGIL